MDNQSDILHNPQFPRANKYDPMWIINNSMGPNVLWLTEFLTQPIKLTPGMRVLDLGCGKGISSVFLAKEFGVQVFAVDLWDSPDGKWEQAKTHGAEHLITPIHADARKLPFAKGFFDAILCIDAYMYFGQEAGYLDYLAQFLRPDGQIGMIVPGFMQDVEKGIPTYLSDFLGDELWTWKTLPWWKNLWEQFNGMSIDVADTLENGCALWLRYEEVVNIFGKNPWGDETAIFRQDEGDYIGFVRMAATKKAV